MARKNVKKTSLVTPSVTTPEEVQATTVEAAPAPVVKETTQTTTAKSRPLPTFGKKVNKKPSVYQLTKGSRDRKGHMQYPVVYMLNAEDTVYDADSGMMRAIRYVPGQKSIFVDEQDKGVKVKSPIVFTKGFLIVDFTNPMLKKYLEMCNRNASNPNRQSNSAPSFKFNDTEAQAKKQLENSRLELDAVTTALNLPLDKLIGYAKVLGVNVGKSTEEIRYDMKVLAERDPAGFIAGLDNPLTDIKQLILRAKDHKILVIKTDSACWNVNGSHQTIVNTPLGVDTIAHLAEVCLTVDGAPIVTQIKAQLERYS